MSIRVAHGRRGEIWIDIQDGRKIATKKALDASKVWSIHREIQILTYLQSCWCDFVPQISSKTHDSFTYPWIQGEHFQTVYDRQDIDEVKRVLLQKLLTRAYQLDQYWVVHGEFLRPFKNMIVYSDGDQDGMDIYADALIYIIDFERGTLRDESGKNMRHLAQWLHSEGWIELELLKTLWSYSRDRIYMMLNKALEDY